MKTKLLLSLLFTFIFYLLSSQVPQSFNYQAIARGSDGREIANTALQVQVSILSDTSGFYFTGAGTYVWEEQQNVTTNSFGLFSLIVGKTPATKIQGSAASFSAINWTAIPLYIGTKIYYLGSWKYLGTAKLGSVPYSMVADSSKALLKGSKLAVVSGNDLSTDALFEVKRKDGQTVFAVYPDAVNIYVPRTSKGTKGGFAIGGFETAKLGPQDYFRVTPDSVRVYIDRTPTIAKGATKGGFAIGGFDQVKGNVQDLLTVSNDSIRMYINDAPGKSSTKGGFAIGGFEEAKNSKLGYLRVTADSTRIFSADSLKGFGVGNINNGVAQNFLKLTTDNYFIGHEAGKNNTIGEGNAFIGYQSGYLNTEGSQNVFLGHYTGYSNTTGILNVFMGPNSGYNNTSGVQNILVGYGAGYENTSGLANIFIGTYAGGYNTTGHRNVFIGNMTGRYNTTGAWNVFLGRVTGYNNTTGNLNTFVGSNSGNANTIGEYNVFLGAFSGTGSDSTTYNVCIGPYSGRSNRKGTENIFLGNYSGSSNRKGNYNTLIGSKAGYNNINGSDNIFIGYGAGYDEDGSDKLYLTNTLTSSNYPMLYGDFITNNNKLVVNGDSSKNLGNSNFFVNGTAGGTSAWAQTSDARLKKNVRTIESALAKVEKMRGVTFEWSDQGFPNGNHMGFIGQETIDIVPEIVNNKGSYLTVEYAPVSALLVEAIKEQQQIIELQKSELKSLKERIELIESMLAKGGVK